MQDFFFFACYVFVGYMPRSCDNIKLHPFDESLIYWNEGITDNIKCFDAKIYSFAEKKYVYKHYILLPMVPEFPSLLSISYAFVNK